MRWRPAPYALPAWRTDVSADIHEGSVVHGARELSLRTHGKLVDAADLPVAPVLDVLRHDVRPCHHGHGKGRHALRPDEGEAHGLPEDVRVEPGAPSHGGSDAPVDNCLIGQDTPIFVGDGLLARLLALLDDGHEALGGLGWVRAEVFAEGLLALHRRDRRRHVLARHFNRRQRAGGHMLRRRKASVLSHDDRNGKHHGAPPAHPMIWPRQRRRKGEL